VSNPTIQLLFAAAMAALAASCAVEMQDTDEQFVAAPPDVTASPAAIEKPAAASTIDPANATYTGVYDDPVTLEDGVYEGEPFVEDSPMRPRLELVEGPRIDTDLDGDGTQETAVLLTENSGGTGHFLYVAVLNTEEGEVRNSGTILVGDRVQIRRFYIDGGQIALDVVQGGPNDAACCPTENATHTFTYADGRLTAGEVNVTGTLSLADIAGIDWQLKSITPGEPVPDSVEITLRLDDAQVAGKSACNQYSGTVSEGDQPGRLSIGPVAGTKMLCPEPAMTWETRYVTALQQMNAYGFLAGDLVLGGVVDGEYVTLRFSDAGR
jgi:heat shock protein HslJ